MNKQTKALKMAIKYFEANAQGLNPINSNEQILQACKEALEQPAQEPVAWNEEEFNAIAYAYRTCPAHEIKMVSDRYQELVNYVLSITHPAPSNGMDKPLFARVVPWQGLSDDEIEIIISKVRDDYYPWKDGMLFGRVARAIEQALKEKNT